MSLVAVYNALKSANVPDDKATAAVEAIEVTRDEPWKRSIEKEITEFRGEMKSEIAEIRIQGRVNTVLIVAVIGILLAGIIR